MKCLEKNPARRYETANGLARDIERHLNSEAVVARPPGNLYRLQKFVHRNRLMVASVSGVMAALIAGLGLSSWLLIKENLARRRAVVAEQTAQRAKARSEVETANSRQVVRFLEDMLQSVGSGVALGKDTELLREVLDKTAGRVGHDLTNQPEVEAELRSVIGNTYLILRENSKAEAMARAALRLRRSALGETNSFVAESLTELARALVNGGRTNRLAEAENLARQALAIWRQLSDHDRIDEALSLYVLGSALQRQHHWPEAEQAHREALEIRRSILKESPEVASSLHNLAGVLRGRSQRSEAERLLCEGLAMDQKLLGPEHPDVLTFLNSLSALLTAEGKAAEAEPLAREALATRRKLFGDEHIEVARSLANLANVLGMEGKTTEAEPLFREALALRRKLLGNQSLDVAWSLASLASFLSKQGRWAEVEPLRRELLAIRRKFYGNESAQAVDELVPLAEALVQQGKLAEAETLTREALALREKMAPNNWKTLTTRSMLGGILLEQKEYSEAEPPLLDAYESMRHYAPGMPERGQDDLTETARRLVLLYQATGRTQQAAKWQRALTDDKATDR